MFSPKTQVRYYLLLLVLIPITACEPIRNRPGSQIKASYVKEAVWDSSTISVCWVTSDLPYKQAAVQKVVTQEFSRAGIDFTGWKECEKAKADIRVAFVERIEIPGEGPSNSAEGLSNIGTGKGSIGWIPFQKDKNKPSLQISRPLSFDKGAPVAYLVMALHEFGHAVGLLHEHIRRDRSDECSEIIKKSIKNQEENMQSLKHRLERVGGTLVSNNTEYDSNSIMSYCKMIETSKAVLLPTLSKTDIKTIIAMYGTKPLTSNFSTEKPSTWLDDKKPDSANRFLWRKGFFEITCSLNQALGVEIKVDEKRYCVANDDRLSKRKYVVGNYLELLKVLK